MTSRGIFLFLTLIIFVAGCDSLNPDSTASTPVNIRIENVEVTLPADTSILTPLPTLTPLPYGLIDALPIMSGICFESAADAAGKVFIMRSAEDHIHLYDLADNSGLCRSPVKRYPFDFANGRILAGIWTYGTGCKARHDILDYQRNDNEKKITIVLKFVTEGDCSYELVRPFWAGIDNAQDYAVDILVE